MNLTKSGHVVAKVVNGVQNGAIAVGTGTGEAGKTFWAGFKAERRQRKLRNGPVLLPKFEGGEAAKA